MLIAGGSSGLTPPHELTGLHRRAPEPTPSRLCPPTQRAASINSSAPFQDRGAAFYVQELLAQQPERGASPQAPAVMLAAYRAHLASRIRHFGPLTPVDLRI